MTQPYSSLAASKSKAISHTTSTILVAAAAWRYFLVIANCDASNGVWLNMLGGTAAANALDCIFLDKLQVLQFSGSGVPSNKITALAVTADVNVTCLVMENPSI